MALVLTPGVQINSGDTVDGDGGSGSNDNLMDLVRLATGAGIDETNFDATRVNGSASIPSLRTLVTDGTSTTATAALSAGDPRVSTLTSAGNAIANRIATSGTPVTIGSTAPTAGQVIVASSATAAAWGTPSVSANITGTGTISSSGTTVTGVGTAFTSQLKVGYAITADSETRRIIAIASATSLTVDSAWTAPLSADAFTFQITPSERPYNTVTAKSADYTVTSADRGALLTMDTTSSAAGTGTVSTTEDSTAVTGSGTDFDPEALAGTRITVGSETRYVVTMTNDTSLTVDRPFEFANTTVAFTVGSMFTFTLPAASVFAEGDTLAFQKISDDANTMRIVPNGSDTIAGLNSAITYRTFNAFVLLVKNGANWRIAHERYRSGEVIQSVSVQTRAGLQDTASTRWAASAEPVIAQGAEFNNKLQVAITPKSAWTRLRFSGVVNLASDIGSGGNVLMLAGIARTGDTNCISVSAVRYPNGSAPVPVPLNFETQSPAVSAQTYTVLGNAINLSAAGTASVQMNLNQSAPGGTTAFYVKKFVSRFQVDEIAI